MQKINFQNLPSTTTPVNASNLNQVQTNVENEFTDYLKNFRNVDNVNLNDLTTSGIYYCGVNLVNSPYDISYVYLFVLSAGGNDLTQIAIPLKDVTPIYIRQRISYEGVTLWGAWQEIQINKYLGNNPDINNLKTNGTYGLYNCNQAPSNNGSGVLEVLVYTADWVLQRYTDIDGVGIWHMWERVFYNGTTWSNWTQRW